MRSFDGGSDGPAQGRPEKSRSTAIDLAKQTANMEDARASSSKGRVEPLQGGGKPPALADGPCAPLAREMRIGQVAGSPTLCAQSAFGPAHAVRVQMSSSRSPLTSMDGGGLDRDTRGSWSPVPGARLPGSISDDRVDLRVESPRAPGSSSTVWRPVSRSIPRCSTPPRVSPPRRPTPIPLALGGIPTADSPPSSPSPINMVHILPSVVSMPGSPPSTAGASDSSIPGSPPTAPPSLSPPPRISETFREPLSAAAMAAERAGLLDSVAMPPPRAHPHPHAHAHAAPIVPVPLIPVVTEVPVQSKGQCDEQSDSEASCRSTPPGDAVASSSSTRDDVSGRDSGSEDGRRRSVGSDGESGDNASSSSSHAAPPSSKRRRRDKTVSRLSFSDELGDGSENEDLRERLSMSTATNKRFRLEERSRRRKEEGVYSFSSSGLSSMGENSPPNQGGRNNAGRIFDDDLSGGPILRVRHDVCERQGKRPYMEDAYLVLRDFLHKVPSDNGGCHLFGVFDGHGGSRASTYARDYMPTLLKTKLEGEQWPGAKEVAEAMSLSFAEIDRKFLDLARQEHLKDGTTALIALLRNNTLHMGWAGDSRGILSRQGRYIRVSEDHKPDRPDERRAVEERGGHVIFRGTYRVAGPTALAVSRAIGDILMKEPRKLVIADPEINTINLLPQDEFLVMASDGLFDVMGDQNVIDTVAKHLLEHKSCEGAAERLTDMAMEKGSMDNVTVLVVQFIWGGCPEGEDDHM